MTTRRGSLSKRSGAAFVQARSATRAGSLLARAARTSPWVGFRVGLLGACALLGALGCDRDKADAPSGSAPSAAASPAAPSPSAAPQSAPSQPYVAKGSRKAVGPLFEVLPGRGLGPIRFGATFATVERHMQHPCDVRTETKCIYVDQAVEFTMKDGVVVDIQVHRRDRVAGKSPDGKTLYYGSFHGGLLPEIALGLHKDVAVTELRPAERVEVVDPPNEHGTVERHHYRGIVLEYDRLPNGNTVLGSFHLLNDPQAESPALPKAGALPPAQPPAAPAKP